MGRVRVGISGWRYPGWRGNFYPPGLAQRRELEYAASHFSTLEINGTFYSLQRPESFAQWYHQTPRGFRFAVKGGRYITHFLKLKGIEAPLANFFASGVLLLREKLGPILWQFPPKAAFDTDRFEAFLSLLPRNTTQAAALAQGHDRKLRKDRAWTKADAARPVRHAVEVRSDSFLVPEFIEMLRRHNVSLVVSDAASKWPTAEDVTASFVYIRLHGSRRLYVSGYTDKELDRWAARVRVWSSGSEPRNAHVVSGPSPRAIGRDVYVYFDNTDVKLRAPIDAANFARRVENAIGLRRSPLRRSA
jgi:uncharacterized protein YecE (DUF72 family)